jgi:hypothetical protein
MAEFWINTEKLESPIRAWDKLTLGGITFPGIVRLSTGVNITLEPNKVQTKAASGDKPAQFAISLADRGYNAAKVRATIEVWTKEQWEDLEETLPKFTPRTGEKQGSSIGGTANNPNAQRTKGIKGRDAFDIVHPATALLGITAVIVEAVSLPEIVDQTLVVTLDMLQYFPQHGVRTVHGNVGNTDNLDSIGKPKAGGGGPSA